MGLDGSQRSGQLFHQVASNRKATSRSHIAVVGDSQFPNGATCEPQIQTQFWDMHVRKSPVWRRFWPPWAVIKAPKSMPSAAPLQESKTGSSRTAIEDAIAQTDAFIERSRQRIKKWYESLKARACLSRLVPKCTKLSGRTPGSKPPASPPPLPRPDGGGQPWPCTCVHGPKKSDTPAGMSSTCPKDNANCENPQNLHCLDQPRHLSLHNNRHVTDSVQHRRKLPDLHNQHQPLCQCTGTGESQWSLKSETMGSCLCAPAGMLTTMKRNCNCGRYTVLRIWIRAFVVHTTGTTTLSKSWHL